MTASKTQIISHLDAAFVVDSDGLPTGLTQLDAGNLSNISGANVVGAVANATYASSSGVADSATVAASANSVAGANVVGAVANATYAVSSDTANSATVAASANSVAGANVSGVVANANYAAFASEAFSVAGSNVVGVVANATFADAAQDAYGLDTDIANVIIYGGSNGQVLGTDGAGNVSWVSISGGANANYANYAGEVIGSSQGNITTLGNLLHIDFDQTSTSPVQDARMVWNTGEGTVDLGLADGITLNIGTQEYARVYNAEATTLVKGEIVYVFGAQGNRVSVKRAQANAEATSIGTLGMVSANIAAGAEGFVTVSGAVYKLNTSTLTAGAPVYLSPSVAGGYTTTKPVAPDHLVVLGWVERVDSTVGSIYVKVDNGYELDELHNVAISNAQNGQALVYSGNVWVNGNAAYANAAGSATVADSANSVALANVSGAGNIASLNLDGDAANVLYGNGIFSSLPPQVVPAGNSGELQFNDGGAFSATSNLTYNQTTGVLASSSDTFSSNGLYSLNSYGSMPQFLANRAIEINSAAGTRTAPTALVNATGITQSQGITFKSLLSDGRYVPVVALRTQVRRTTDDANVNAQTGLMSISMVGRHDAANSIYNRMEQFQISSTINAATDNGFSTGIPGQLSQSRFTPNSLITTSGDFNFYKSRGYSPLVVNANGSTSTNTASTYPLQIGDRLFNLVPFAYSGNGTQTNTYGTSGYVQGGILRWDITDLPTGTNTLYGTKARINVANASANVFREFSWENDGRYVTPGLTVSSSNPPASATDTGTQGDIRWDANYVYVCIATNTWKRSALSTW